MDIHFFGPGAILINGAKHGVTQRTPIYRRALGRRLRGRSASVSATAMC